MAEGESGEKAKTVVEVYPLSKMWRIGSFLADFFIHFFFALFLYQVCLYPLAGLIVHSDALSDELTQKQNERDSVLYGNSLLFAKGNKDIDYLSSNLSYTGDQYLSYFVSSGVDGKDEIFHTYFIVLRNNQASYQSFYENNDTTADYFRWANDAPVLQSKYVTEFAPHFDPNDALSSQAQKDLDTFMSSFFLKGYSAMLQDVASQDLTYNGISYRESQARVVAIEKEQELTVVVTSLLSDVLSSLALFLLIPCLNKNRKTIGMMALRKERVNASRLILLRKRDVLYRYVYDFASTFGTIFFLPMIQIGFNELFALPILFPLSLVSIGYVIISLFFVLFDSFNRSLGDRLTGTVMVDEESLDQIYRSKGYQV
jgi:hypothetical protein